MENVIPNIREGQVIKVVQKVSDAGRTRNVPFTGVVKKVRGAGVNKSITVRQTLEGVEVDRIFSVEAPTIVEISLIAAKEKITKKIKRARKQKGKK